MNEGSRERTVEECGVSDGRREEATTRTSPVDRYSSRTGSRGIAPRLLAWLALAASLIAGRPIEAGTVTGTVKNSATNGALSGVLVKVNEQPGKQATTNSSGAYTITSVTAGSVTLALSKTGFVSATSAPVTVPASGTVTVPAITLLKLGTITGTVVNASSGAGVATATVTVTGTSTQTTTSSSGSFTISSAAGSVTLTISKSGWETKVTGPYTIVDGGTVNAGSIPLVRYGVVRGKLLDQNGGTPLIGATATLSGGGGTGTTDSTGTFSITCVPATYTATFSMTGYATVVSSEFTVQPGVTLTLSDTSLQLLGTATGLVTDEASGAPLSGVLVAVFGGTASTTTGADGRFAIPVPPVSTSLVLAKAGFGTVRTDAFTVGSGETSDVGSFSLGAGGVLSGFVVDAGSGAPLPGALVSIQPPLVAMLTDASGAFSFDLAPGDYSLGLSRDGWVAGTAGPFTVDVGVTTNAGSLPLVEKGTIIGTVVKASDGTPVVGATVRVVGSAGTVTTDAAGHFSTKAVPGSATLAISAPPLAPALAGPATVVSAQSVDVGTVALVTAGTITGTVVAADYGYPLSSAVVTVPGTASEAITNTAGAFTLYVAPGTVSVTATKAGWSTATVGPYSVAANGTVATGAIPLTRYGVVRGEVLADDDGSPIEGVTVTLSGGGGTGTTDSTGTFSISCPPATYTATFSRVGFDTYVSAEFTTWSGVTLTIWDTYLQRLGTATGLVTSAASGLPLAGVRVAVFGGTDWTTTDVDGQFAIPVPPVSTRLVLSKAGFGTVRTDAFTVGPGETSDVGPFSLGVGGVLSGVVVDAGTAAPLAGVLVSLQPQLDSRVTDATGAFSFELAPGDYSLDLSREGFVAQTSGPHLVSEGQTTDIGSLSLVQGGTITGTVVKLADGTPVAGAVVRLIGATGPVTTDAAGQFAIVSAPGTVTLAVSAPPLAPALAGPVTVISAQTVDAGTISLGVGGTITGTVVAAEYGYPVSSAVVSVAGTASEAVTNYAGAFTLYVAPGSVSVTATKAGWSTATVGPFAVAAGESVATGAIPLTRWGIVTGKVLAEDDDSAIEGATVTLSGGGGTGTTDSTGTFSISCAPATYTATFSRTGFETLTSSEFTTWSGVTLTIWDTRLARHGMATGLVTNSADGQPLPGVRVGVFGGSGWTNTGPDGRFATTVPPVPTRLVLSKAGFGTVLTGEFVVEIGQSTEVGPFALGAGGVLSGNVVDAGAGTPLAGALVSLQPELETRLTDALGAFSFDLASGDYSLVLSRDGWASGTAGPFSVAVGVTTNAGALPLSELGTVIGTVVKASDGTPVAGASVLLVGASETTATDAAGRFSIKAPPGAVTLVVSAPPLSSATVGPVTVVSAQTVDAGTIPLLPPGTLRGTVVGGPSNVPVQGAVVRVNGATDVTTTDAEGAFVLVQPAGTVTLTVSKQGFTSMTTDALTVTSGSVTETGPLHLVMHGSVIGRVASSVGGVPLAGATIELGSPQRTATSAVDGTFVLESIPAGSLGSVIRVTLNGYSLATAWARLIFDGQATDVGTILLDSPNAFDGTVRGSVVDDATGLPVAGAMVRVFKPNAGTVASGATDSNGGFAFLVGPSTGLSIQASTTGRANLPLTELTVESWRTSDVGALRLVPVGIVRGDLASGYGSTICIKDTDWCTWSSDYGLFELAAPAGTWDVVAWLWPEKPATKRSVVVVAGETIDIGEIDLDTLPPIYWPNVSGTAIGAFSRAPISYGLVTLSNSSLPATSISSGQFGFRDVPPGSYAAITSSPGWLPATGPSFTLTAGSTADAGTIAMTRGGKVVGTVRESSSGRPLAGADVLAPGTGFLVRTDEYGGFVLSLPEGAYTVKALKPGWLPAQAGPVSVSVGSVANVGFLSLVPESTAPGLVTGRVRAGDGPAVGARVVALPEGSSTLTDGEGRYSLSVPSGAVSVVASLGGWASAGSPQATLLAGQTATIQDLALTQPVANVSGHVLNRYGSAPIPDAIVTVDGTNVATRTDAAGSFQLAVPPGAARVQATLEGWSVADLERRGLALESGQSATGIVLTMEALSRVSGLVVDAVDGAPVAGVHVSSSGFSVETDANGSFSTLAPPGPDGRCDVSKQGWPSASIEFAAPLGQPVALGSVPLAGNGALVGKVTWNREPFTSNQVATVLVEQTGDTLTTDTEGLYRITVPPGTYTIRASRSSFYDTVTSAPVSVISGETMEVEPVHLAGYGNAYGSLRIADTVLPLEGVTVTATETGESTVSNSGGGFSLRLHSGEYTLIFAKAGYVTQKATEVRVEPVFGAPFVIAIGMTPETTFELAQLAIEPESILSFETATGTLIARGPAPTGGATVTLSSDNPSAVTMPETVSFLEGELTASFPITGTFPAPTRDVKITARSTEGGRWSETWDFVHVYPPPPIVLQGISPATALPGDGEVLAYVEDLSTAGYTVSVAGPVYAFDDPSVPLCDLATSLCPTQSITAALEPGSNAVRFTLPEGLGEGYYAARVVEVTGRSTSWGWLGVEARQKSLPAQTPEEHRAARRLLPGQVVTGTFAENGDPNGNLGDYNFFYFIAPAGSEVTARLERVDTSQPWEAPSSLDPQLELIAPDGFIYANLRKLDDAAGSDLNATLTNAVLPQGGLWLLAAETRRGAGDYRLTFDLAPAPPATGERAIPISGNGNTLPLGVPLTSTAIVLDPRGHPLSGAGVTFVSSTAPENKGILEFAGGNTVTSGPDGSAIVTATFTTAGKASLTPTLSLPLFANLVADASAMKARAEIPLYEPVGRWPVAVRDFLEDTIELRPAARESSRPSVRGLRGDAGGEGRSRSTGATDATPLPRSVGDGRRVATLDRVSGCQGGTFSNAGVAVPEVHAPFSLTLEDLTPKPGEVTPPGPVGTANGIEGHRVDKTIRLRLTVRDGTGNVPSHPVLVQMTVGGPKAGKLILDPDGARIECTSVSFLWHDQDAQGNVTDPNEIVEYQLGEYSRIDGFTADGQTPGAVKPVWGTTEELRIVLSAPDASGTETWEGMLDQTFPVRPEPGKPDHFACFDQNGDPCPDSFPFWTGHLAYPAGLRADGSPKLATNPHRILNAYYLADEFENETFGYTATSAPSPGPNLTVGFTDQTRIYPDFEQYTLAVSWNNEPAFPQGTYPVTLSVDYPEDPEWSSGTVSRSITLEMQGGSTHVLSRYQDYDLIRPDGTNGIEDGRFPLRTWPGASGDWIQKSTGGDPARLVLLTEVGEVVSGVLPAPEPIPTKSRFWRRVGDHWEVYREITEQALETTSPASFRLSLIKDGSLEPIADGAFLVQLCPRFDHWDAGAPCTTSPVASSGGVAEVTVNASNGRGYLGVSLTAAPAERGSYYIRVQSLDSTYRIRRQSDYVTGSSPTAGEFEGAFSIVNVETLEAADNRCGPRECSNCTGSPCFVRTGVYTAAETDLTVPTAGLPLAVGRTYLSSPRPDGVLRGGWTSSTEARLTWSEEAGRVRARVLMPDGEEATYALDPVTKTWTPPAGRHDTLVKNANGTFDLLLERGAGAFLHFGADGLLSSVCDENGNVQTREHDAAGLLTRVSDDSGRFIDLTWTAGKLTSVTDSGGRTVTYEYDGQDRLHRVVDPAGRVRRYEYVPGRYSHSLLSKVTDGWGRTLNAITWDTEDRTSSYTEGGETYAYSYLDTTHSVKTDSQGHQKFFTFDAGSGLITDTSGPGGEATSTTYDANGHPLLATDPAGIASQYAYDGKGRVLSATRDSQGSSAVRFDYGYDPDFPDRVVSVTPKDPATNARNPNWQGWTYEYHPNGSTRPGSLKTVYRVASNGTTADAVSRYEYDPEGRVTRQTTAGGAETDYGYDASGNLETVTGPAGTGGRPVTEYGHDALGRVTRVTDSQGKETSYTYDSLGRVLTVTLPPVDGRTFTTTYTYDQHDEPTGLVYTEITDPNGRLTRLGYDAEGRLRRSVDAAGGATNYDYTGRFLSSITDPNGNVTTYDYNPAGRLATTSFPDGGQENYSYWSDGLLKTKTDRRGTTVTYTYDAFKRIVSKAYSTGGSITYTYEGQKLVEVTDTTVTPAETHSFGYDERYRLASTTQAARGSITYTYTADDRVETLGITSGPSATYAYNPDGSLDSLQWSVVPGAFTWDYTPRGQYDTLTFPSGQTRAYAYDDQGRLTSLTNSLGATTLASFAYGYDLDLTGQPTLLGQRTSQTATLPAQGLSGALTRYGYDPLYQLTRAEYPAGAPFNSEVHTWTYDGIGNRATQGIGANVQTYTYLKAAGNPLNGQRLESDGVDSYGYDPAGSLATRQGPGGSSIFGYDSENRLASITGPTAAIYTYDYQGRRTSKTVDGVTTTYLYDGLNLLSETTNGQTTHFLNGPGIDEPLAMARNGAISYFSVDGLGSVVATNNPSGAVTHSVVFDAWGKVKAETGTREHPFTYTGRETGEAGFHFYRARFYQPSIGRFSQEDPILFAGGSPSLYGYVRATPTTHTDPTGLWATYRHNWLLNEAFRGTLPPAELQLLMDASWYADRAPFQDAEHSEMHAMAGIRYSGSIFDTPRPVVSRQSRAEAERRFNAYLCERKSTALKMKERSLALWALGMGMHAIMDNLSPSHSGFRSWAEPTLQNGVLPLANHMMGDTEAYEPALLQEAISRIRVYYNEFVNEYSH
jgi:RHS repeat-associated protein